MLYFLTYTKERLSSALFCLRAQILLAKPSTFSFYTILVVFKVYLSVNYIQMFYSNVVQINIESWGAIIP